MHARTYADPKVTIYQDKFVWILVDPTVSSFNEDLKDEYDLKLQEEFSEILSLPTAVFLDASGKIVRSASGKVKADDFVGMMKEILGE